ncbi:MAG: beta-propeller fold lactonase family protein [Solirubrobacteraceae bacterium]
MNHIPWSRASLATSLLALAGVASAATPALAADLPAFATPPTVSATIPITSPNNAYQAAYDESTGLLYVANPAASEIDVVYTAQATPASTGGVYHTQWGDPEVDEVVERIDVDGAEAFGLTIDQETHRLFATSTVTDQLLVIQANDGTSDNGVPGSAGQAAIVAKTPIPGHIREVRAFSGDPSTSDDNLVYVTAVNDNAVVVVDPQTGRVERVFDDLVDREAYPNANWIAGLALNDVGPGTGDDVLYTTSMNQDAQQDTDHNGLVNVIDRTTGRSIQSIDAQSHETTSLAYSAKYHKLYAVGQSTVQRGDDGTVATFDVDPDTGKLTLANAVRVGRGALGVAVDEGTGRVFVTNFGAGTTVSVLDAATGDVVGAPLTVGQGALNTVIDPVSHTAYVTNQRDASVSMIDAATPKVTGSFPLASPPRLYQSAYNPNTGLLYVADPSSRRVHVIYTEQATRQSTGGRYVTTGEDGSTTDPAPNTIVARINVADNPVYGLGINTRTNTLYGTATTTGDGQLVTIDLAVDKVRKVVDMPGHIRDVRVDERHDKAYVVAYSSNEVVEYDGATDQVARRISITTDNPLAAGPGGLTVDAEHGLIYTANLGDSGAGLGSISVIDIPTGTTRQVISSDIPGTTTVAYDAAARRVVATSQGAAGVTPLPPGGVTTFAVSPQDGTLTKVNSFLSTPGALGTAVDSAGGYAISTDYGLDDGTVTLVRTATGEKLGTVGVGAKPLFTSVDPVSRNAYITNQGSATVSVLAPGTLREEPQPQPQRSSLRLHLRPDVVRAGASAWLSVKVKVEGRGRADGAVEVKVDGRLVKATDLHHGGALVRISTGRLRTGAHQIRVTYAGSPTVRPSEARTTLRIVARHNHHRRHHHR